MIFSWMHETLGWPRALPIEALFWATALVAVAVPAPQTGLGMNLCLIEALGLPCLGDGLGRSIAHLARGQVAASWAAHPLGGPAVAILIGHIGRLLTSHPRSSTTSSVSS